MAKSRFQSLSLKVLIQWSEEWPEKLDFIGHSRASLVWEAPVDHLV